MSKTVKRVSKTVKRVTRVMVIGLVAILGVEAEAHYIVIGGRCFWHSGQCVRQDSDVPPDAITNPARGELFVGRPLLLSGMPPLLLLDILCPNGSLLKDIDLSDKVDLFADTPIVRGYITNVVPNSNIFRYAEWEVNVSHAPFLDTNFTTSLNTNFCSTNGVPEAPRDVIIRAMSVEMNLYCVDADATICPDKLKPHSTLETTCTLPKEFNLKNYPKNLPSRGDRFACSGTVGSHLGIFEPL